MIPLSSCLRRWSGSAFAWAACGWAGAAPVVMNPGFEDNLNGWTATGVAITTERVHEGVRSLSLQGGSVSQTVTGLVPGERYTLSLAYRDDTPESYILSHARLLIGSETIGEVHNGQDHEYLDAGGFEFTAPAASVILRIESLAAGPGGLLIDDIRIVGGGLPAPPEHPWESLEEPGDARGGRRLANGGFESETSDPEEDHYNSGPEGNPHLCGSALPGWLVTRENVDLIQGVNAPEGAWVLDTGGHGPGGIAQTITGLVPGGVYTFSFLYARHASWGEDEMTGEVLANGRPAESLVRTIAQTWEDGYELKEIPVLASEQGKLTLEIRSTTTDQGGNIVYDDLRLKAGGNGFQAWVRHYDVEDDPNDDADSDGLEQGLEFLLGSDPSTRSQMPLPAPDGNEVRLRVPLSGLALSQGFVHELWCSRDLVAWVRAEDPGSGCHLISDSTGGSVNGERIYMADEGEAVLFWRHASTSP